MIFLGVVVIPTSDLARLLLSRLWDVSFRSELENLGVQVSPSNYYSSLPSLKDIEQSFEYSSVEPPFANNALFNLEALKTVLNDLITYAGDFNPPKEGNEDAPLGYFLQNPQFSKSDPFAAFALIKKHRPRSIVEIGSGFSTLLLVATQQFHGGKVVCVDPYPRSFVRELAATGQLSLIEKPVQELTASHLNSLTTNGDFIFIDSTHTVKTGSDCVHLYLRLIPNLQSKILIHVHDVFLPYPLPRHWLVDHQIFWTE